VSQNGWGGKREGAGKKIATATLIAQKFRKALAKRINKDANKWMDAIEDAALGHWIEAKQIDGSMRVYKTKPDPNAWQKATDRAFGNPEQGIDLTTQGEKIGELREILLVLANERNRKDAEISSGALPNSGGETDQAHSDAKQDIQSRLQEAIS